MQRESRYISGKPIIRNGNTVTLTITDNDIAILKILARYPYLDIPWISALAKRPQISIKQRIYQLKRAGFIKVADAQTETREARRRNLFERLCIELAPAGAKVLSPFGIAMSEKTTNILEHQAMTSQVMASFELGANGRYRLIPWTEILAQPEAPRTIHESPESFVFKRVAYTYRNERRCKDVRPDGLPFGIAYEDTDEIREYFCIGIEADNGTEPIESSRWARSSIERKFYEYTAIAEQQLYKARLGFPNIFVPFIFRSETRLNTALNLLATYDAHLRLKGIFLFNIHSAEPNTNMLTVPFKRITKDGIGHFMFN